jgi:hypothetical protein
MYALCNFGQNFDTWLSAFVWYMVNSIIYQELHFEIRKVHKEIRYYFVIYFLSIRKVVLVEINYKKVSNRTLLGPIQAAAVYWCGVITKIV